MALPKYFRFAITYNVRADIYAFDQKSQIITMPCYPLQITTKNVNSLMWMLSLSRFLFWIFMKDREMNRGVRARWLYNNNNSVCQDPCGLAAYSDFLNYNLVKPPWNIVWSFWAMLIVLYWYYFAAGGGWWLFRLSFLIGLYMSSISRPMYHHAAIVVGVILEKRRANLRLSYAQYFMLISGKLRNGPVSPEPGPRHRNENQYMYNCSCFGLYGFSTAIA